MARSSPLTRSCSAVSWARRFACVVSAIAGCYPRSGHLSPGGRTLARALRVRVGAGMRRVVGRAQTFRRDLRVHLGGGDARVAEQLLHDPEIGAVIEHVRGARVA